MTALLDKAPRLRGWWESVRPEAAPWPPGSRWGRLAWLLTLLLFLGVVVATELLPFLARELPAEADDSYVRIAHAARLAQCPLGDCPALTDLRQELLNPAALSDYRAWDIISRALLLLSPLHDLALVALRGAGVPWENGHGLMAILSAVVTALGFGLWLRALFPPATAALALFFQMALIPLLPGHGLLHHSPTTLATGLALLAWAALPRRGAAAAPLLAALIPVMITAHLLGKVWAVVTVAGFLWHAPPPWSRGQRLALGAGVAVIVAAFLVPLLLPALDVPPVTGALHRDLPQVVAWNLPKLAEAWDVLAFAFRRGWLLLLLVVAGLAALAPRQRLTLLFWGGMLTALLTVSLVNYHPGLAGTLLGRVFLPWQLLLLGLAAHGLLAWPGRLWSQRRQRPAWAWGLAYAALAFLTLTALVRQGATAVHDIPQLIRHKTIRQDFALPAAQTALLPPSCGRVAYDAIAVMFASFSHGGLACGAVALLPQRPELARPFLPQVTHLATWGPFRDHRGRLALTPGQTLTLTGSGALTLAWEGEGGELLLRAPGRPETRVTLPAGAFQHTVTLDAPLTVTATRGTSFLAGAARPGATLRWPWDQGVTLTHGDGQGAPHEVTFASRALWREDGRPVRVLDDQGSALLARIEP